jgi:thymidylate synthase
MLIKADTVDDALRTLVARLIKSGKRTISGKGPAREFKGVLVEISNPLARFSRTEGRGMLIAFVGETCWYLSGSDRLAQIEYYIPKYRSFIGASPRAVRARGAYGPRLFGGGEESQMKSLLATLQKKQGRSDTRQAVAQIFDRSDLRRSNGDVPCTTTLQFLPRTGKLHLITTMRSNDVYRGLPADVFAFTFIQELVARALELEIGPYSHFVGSLHLYDHDGVQARSYLDEGFQSPMSMPAMPKGDPWRSVSWLLEAEHAIRSDRPEPQEAGINDYWIDLARLLRIKKLYGAKDLRGLIEIKNEMASPIYNTFIRGQQRALERNLSPPTPQPDLPGMDVPQTKRSS